jgi:hypothetical protein
VDDEVREQLRQDMLRHTITLNEIAGRPLDATDVAKAVIGGFVESWGINDTILAGNQYFKTETGSRGT